MSTKLNINAWDISYMVAIWKHVKEFPFFVINKLSWSKMCIGRSW